MELLVKSSQLTLEAEKCYTEDELKYMGVTPTDIDCFTFYNYFLFKKGNKRVILKPLPHDLYMVIRIYDFISA